MQSTLGVRVPEISARQCHSQADPLVGISGDGGIRQRPVTGIIQGRLNRGWVAVKPARWGIRGSAPEQEGVLWFLAVPRSRRPQEWLLATRNNTAQNVSAGCARRYWARTTASFQLRA